MKPVIIKLAGTHGSGKSTAVRWLLQHPSERVPHVYSRTGNYYDTLVELPNKRLVVVLGPYNSGPCGGIDIPAPTRDFNDHVKRLKFYARKGYSVLFEGALLMGWGRMGEAMHSMRRTHQPVFAYMDTPLELCLQRQRERRARSTKTLVKPLNETNCINKWKSQAAALRNIQSHGYEPVLIDHRRPIRHLSALLGLQINREPRVRI